jgi:hypothetical protein
MKHLKLFEDHNTTSTLLVVDVQKSFKKFYTPMYLNELIKFCGQFTNVYQLWDNHVEGKDVDTDYLYHNNPKIPISNDLYNFPNQKDLIEKRYNYAVNADFYRKNLDKDVYTQIKDLENKKQLKKGQYFPTKVGTIIVFIGNNHQWFECPKKLLNLLNSWKGQEVTVVGGAREECLKDVVVVAEALGVVIKTNFILTYSATQCYF